MSRKWVESDIAHLNGEDYHTAKLILVVAMASYQVDDSIVQAVLVDNKDQKKLIRVLAFAALAAALRLAAYYGQHVQPAVANPATGVGVLRPV